MNILSKARLNFDQVRGWTVIAVFWLVLYLLGHPIAFTDDIFYIGGAFSLVDGHGYINPYCPSLVLVGSKNNFFSIMPLHGHVLAAWLTVFGRSRMSLDGFQCLVSALASGGIWEATRKKTGSIAYPLMLSLALAAFLSSTGLRPEGLGLAFLALGLLIYRNAEMVCWTVGCLSLFATIITCPVVGILAPFAFVGACYYQVAIHQRGRKEMIRRIVWAGITGLVILLLFLVLIRFEVRQFIEEFGANGRFVHQARSTGRILSRCLLMEAVLVSFLIFVYKARSLFELNRHAVFLTLVALAALAMTIAGVSSAVGVRFFGLFFLLTVLFFVERCRKPFSSIAYCAWLGMLTLYILSSGRELIQLIAVDLIAPQKSYNAIRELADTYKGGAIYIDCYAQKDVFNYQLPKNGLDYAFGLTDRWDWNRSPKDYPQGSLLILSKQTLISLGMNQTIALHGGARTIPVVRWLDVRAGPPLTSDLNDYVAIPGGSPTN